MFSFDGFTFPLYPEFKVVIPPKSDVHHHLEQFRPDLIHVLSPVAMGVAGMWQARRQHIPVVASFHTDVPGYVAHYGLAALESPIWAAMRFIHNQADLNLCPSHFTYEQLASRGIHSLRLWTRGVDTDQFHPNRASAEWRARLTDGEPEKPLLIFVGRLSLEKRVHWLPDLVQRFPDVRLAIVGDGPERQSLEQQCRDLPVVFTGYLQGEDLAQAYASADIFVFPSASETLGNVVLEAMASGLAVVAADKGGPRELITSNHDGLLFSSQSFESLVSLVGHLLVQPQLQSRLRINARTSAMTRTWSSVLDTLLGDYAEVIRTGTRESRSRFSRTGRSQPVGRYSPWYTK
ncbi:MAG: glycosyltransferase family 1 protein [Chloroflexota bacterium]